MTRTRWCRSVPLLALLFSVATTLPDPFYGDLETSGYGPEGSGSAYSGSGSGDPAPSDCKIPQVLLDSPTTQEEELLAEIRCHTACLQRVLSQEEIAIEVFPAFPLWPQIPNSVLDDDCRIFQKVQECRTGCVVHSESRDMTLRRCRNTCFASCTDECNGQNFCDQRATHCLRGCNRDSCETGCMVYEEEVQRTEGKLPPQPVATPSLSIPMESRIAGQYLVNISNTSPMDDTRVDDLNATSFIFRLLQLERNGIAYYWLPSFEDQLVLDAFACEDVTLQFAAVNPHGRSGYSPPLDLNVYGESVRNFADNPDPSFWQFEVEPDTRFGFWKHGVIRFSWERPRGFQFLSQYVVIVFPSRRYLCGLPNGREIIVHRDATSVVISAEEPLSAPVDGCTYDITISSRSMNQEAMQPPPSRSVAVSVDNPVPLNLMCNSLFDESTGKFFFSMLWSIPDYAPLHEAIKSFAVVLQLVTDGFKSPRDVVPDIVFNPNKATYLYDPQLEFPSFDEPGYFYSIELTTKQIAGRLENGIITPEQRNCTFAALPLPPTTIDDITILSESVGVANASEGPPGTMVLALTLDWSSPSGNISRFELRLVEQPTMETILDEIFFKQFLLSDLPASIRVPLPEAIETECLYLQVRSITGFRAISNWSKPLCIQVGLLRPMTTPTPAKETLPKYIYVVVAVGGLMILAVSIMALLVCLACVQNKRAAKQAVLMGKQPSIRRKQSTTSSTYGHFQASPSPLAVGLGSDGCELHPSQVIIETRLGEGAFGDIYRGTVQRVEGSPTEAGRRKSANTVCVAVKLLKATASHKEKQNFILHIQQSKNISKKPHPHMVGLVGCVTVHEPICLIARYPEGGDLLTYLEGCRKHLTSRPKEQPPIAVDGKPAPYLETAGAYSSLEPRTSDSDGVPGGLESADLISFAAQIASGMEYLGSLGVVHGDLACHNVFMEGPKKVLISDFGLSHDRHEEGVYVKTMTGRLPLRWMALESITEGEFSTATDVWAFGVTLWEVITLGGFPYPNITNKELLTTLKRGYRMERPDNCSKEVYDIMQRCWEDKPPSRPTFSHLQQTFQAMLASPDCSHLVKLEFDERKPCYRKTSLHERLHRSNAAGVTYEGGISFAPSHAFVEQMLSTVEEVSERESSTDGSSSGCICTEPHTECSDPEKPDDHSSDEGVTEL